MVACIGEAAGRSNKTGAWVSASQVMETVMVPSGKQGDQESKDKQEDKNQTESTRE